MLVPSGCQWCHENINTDWLLWHSVTRIHQRSWSYSTCNSYNLIISIENKIILRNQEPNINLPCVCKRNRCPKFAVTWKIVLINIKKNPKESRWNRDSDTAVNKSRDTIFLPYCRALVYNLIVQLEIKIDHIKKRIVTSDQSTLGQLVLMDRKTVEHSLLCRNFSLFFCYITQSHFDKFITKCLKWNE